MIGLFTCLPAREARAQFSAFARITPETEERYGVYVQILPLEGQDDKCAIVVPQGHAWQGYYLILCTEKVPPKEQDFRSYLWSQRPDRTDVLSVAPLLPPAQYDFTQHRSVPAPKPPEVILNKSLLAKSYIYIDYPKGTLDGGYYYCVDLSTYPLPEDRKMTVRYSPAEGLGPEPGVARRDPSDIIRVSSQYHLWYVKSQAMDGSDAAIWYATSGGGRRWVEKGEALCRGPKGSWDAGRISGPNILVADGKYYLFYTGESKPLGKKKDAKAAPRAIGVAVAQCPDGPWERLPTNPVLRCAEEPRYFEFTRFDNCCPLVREGRYWLYYRGSRSETDAEAAFNRLFDRKTRDRIDARLTGIGFARAEKPEGPYVDHRLPIIEGGRDVSVWPLGMGVAAMVDRGLEEADHGLLFAADGWRFSRMLDVTAVPGTPGVYRPEAFTDSGKGKMIEWGIHAVSRADSPTFLERFDCQWVTKTHP
jgi:hypothetical protein